MFNFFTACGFSTAVGKQQLNTTAISEDVLILAADLFLTKLRSNAAQPEAEVAF